MLPINHLSLLRVSAVLVLSLTLGCRGEEDSFVPSKRLAVDEGGVNTDLNSGEGTSTNPTGGSNTIRSPGQFETTLQLQPIKDTTIPIHMIWMVANSKKGQNSEYDTLVKKIDSNLDSFHRYLTTELTTSSNENPIIKTTLISATDSSRDFCATSESPRSALTSSSTTLQNLHLLSSASLPGDNSDEFYKKDNFHSVDFLVKGHWLLDSLAYYLDAKKAAKVGFNQAGYLRNNGEISYNRSPHHGNLQKLPSWKKPPSGHSRSYTPGYSLINQYRAQDQDGNYHYSVRRFPLCNAVSKQHPNQINMSNIYKNPIGSIASIAAGHLSTGTGENREKFFDHSSRSLKVFVIVSHLDSPRYTRYNRGQPNNYYTLASSTPEAFTKLLEDMNPPAYKGDLAHYYKFFSYNTNTNPNSNTDKNYLSAVDTLKGLSEKLGGFHNKQPGKQTEGWEMWSKELIKEISKHQIIDLHFDVNQEDLLDEITKVTVNGKRVHENSYYKINAKKVAFKARKYLLLGEDDYTDLQQDDEVKIWHTLID